MRILALDPGPVRTAWLLYDTGSRSVGAFGHDMNPVIRNNLDAGEYVARKLVIEMIACYGMAVGAEVFETCTWIGHFECAARRSYGLAHRLFRREVKMHLCNAAHAKDPNVRQALIDRFGGKVKAIGTKKAPGPLYGIAGDCWAALGVAVTYAAKVRAGEGAGEA